MSRTIQYGIDEDCFVWSRVGNKVAVPNLDFENMTPENNYEENYNLEEMNIFDVAKEVGSLKWTRKIPVEIKNIHRKFWGFAPLKEKRK